jgi:uncharacterized protein YjbI with pentapeptide repeats
MKSTADAKDTCVAIEGQVLTRQQLELLILDATSPLVFTACDFQGLDLSRLNMRGFEFRDCTFMESSLYAAALSHTTWLQCRARQADFEAADLVDAQFKNCDLNNTQWRRARLSSVAFTGCKLTGANFEEVAHLGLEACATHTSNSHDSRARTCARRIWAG